MTTVDVHAHVAPADAIDEMRRLHPDGVPVLERTPDGVYYRYPSGVVNGPVPLTMVDVDARIGRMDAGGIDRQALSVRPQLVKYDLDATLASRLVAVQNDHLLGVVESHPDRFDALITLPLQAPDAAVAEIGRWAADNRVRGVIVDSNIGGRNLDDPAFEPIWAELSAADLGVLVHPYQADVAGKERLGSYYLFNLIGNPFDSSIAIASVLFSGIPDRYPDLRWCFVHGGGAAPSLLGRWDHGWAQRDVARVATSQPPSRAFGRLFFDTVTHEPRALRFLAEIVGWGQVLMGSDFPFDMGDPDPVATVKRLGLGAEDETAVLGGNAERFLRERT